MLDQNRFSTRVSNVIQFPLTRLVLALLTVGSSTTITQSILRRIDDDWVSTSWQKAVAILLICVIVAFSYLLYVWLVEQRRASELDLKAGWRELLLGLGLGGLLFTVIIGMLWGLGYYTIVGVNPINGLIGALSISLLAGFVEEIVFRAIIYRIAEEALGTWTALLLSALLFGAVHLVNPNATLVGGIAIALESGLMLAIMYTWTRRIWLSVGTHISWNFTQGGIFGVAVSGNALPGLLQSRVDGPDLLSGGIFGAEASLIAILCCLLLFVYYLVIVGQARRFVSPMAISKQKVFR